MVNRELKVLPTNQLLQQIWNYISTRANKKGEYRSHLHQCIFLLCWKVGLRVSEAINFDLALEHQEPIYKNLYLLRGKGKKERWVYVAPELIKELKKRNWDVKSKISRELFYKFLQQVKKDMNLAKNIELEPHTLRRCFATYNAVNGMPLPVLQKVLGHSKISTTALYIKDSDLNNLVKFRPI